MMHRAVRIYDLDCEQDASSRELIWCIVEPKIEKIYILIIDHRQLIVTKGDDNEFEDIPLYPQGESSFPEMRLTGW